MASSRAVAGALRWRRHRAGRGGTDRGSAPLELAILWVAIVTLLFGAVQVATYFVARTVALQAAQLAVSTARQYDGTDQDGVDRAEQYLATAGDWLRNHDVGEPQRDEEAGVVTVTVTGEALQILPFLPAWEIEQTAHGTIERFTVP